MRISINLDSRDKDYLRNINTSWSVQFPPKDFSFGNCFLNVFRRIEKTVYVGVKDLSIDENLICEEANLFRIQYGTELFEQPTFPVELKLKQENTPFQVFIDTSKILDCKEQQQASRKIYHICANIFVENDQHSCIREESIDVEVEFIELAIEPSMKIQLDSSYLQNGNLQYDSDLGEIEIGKLICTYNKKWKYTPSINLTARLQLFQEGRLLTNVLNIYKNQQAYYEVDIKNCSKINITYILKVDLSKLRNPSFPQKMSIRNNARYSLSCRPEVQYPLVDNNDGNFDEKMDFVLLPDPHSTELQVKSKFADTEQLESNDGTTHLHLNAFRAGSPKGLRLELSFVNLATDTSNPDAGVFVKHLIVTSEIQNAKVYDKKEKLLAPQDIINVSGDNKEEMSGPNGCFIPNGKNSKSTIFIDFLPEKIDELKETSSYEFQIKTTVCFDYWENKSGASLSDFDLLKKPYKHTFVWNLFQKPNKEWLCVDYGTSAIVCMYDKTIINLRKRKEEILKKDKRYKALIEDEFEQGTNYLSSDIVFHQQPDSSPNISSLCSEQTSLSEYSDLAICLSPTTKMVVTDVLHQIPCLKLLIGHDYVPQPEGYHDLNILYNRKSEEGIISKISADEAKDSDEKNAILKIDNIFLEAYSVLFRHFVLPSIDNINKVNKLILTYPNTYTPVHLNTLSTIAHKVFPNIRPGYLKFVGESDAVAAYYMNNWNDYHDNKEDVEKDETVLVYDMGAGTLDITVFNKRFVNKKYEIEILGKIGTTKAGNYLDALIAKILAEKKFIRPSFVKLNRGASQEIAEAKTNLKIAIKNIKYQLSESVDSDVSIKTDSLDAFKFKVGVITKSKEFEDYISQITEEIIDKLLSYLRDKNAIEIDTVIMSGRACKLKAIKDSLQSVFDKKGDSKQVNIIMLDEPINVLESGNSERQKRAVCEGAVSFCNLYQQENSIVRIKSKRLYANYGITYKSMSKRYYMELIGHDQIPDNSNKGTILFDSKTVSNLGGAEGITLIQSYMSESETLAALESNDNGHKTDVTLGYDYISEMMYIDKEDYDNADSVDIRLELDKNNNISLHINGNPTTKHTPRGLSLESEVTKMSLWPVAIE